MKLSISNIAWDRIYDDQMYNCLQESGFAGLEIAPSRIFPNGPYDDLERIHIWSEKLRETYGLSVSSMQSVWYGRRERLFGSREERNLLVSYTKKAVMSAQAAGCSHIVFGCPRNRMTYYEGDWDKGAAFFRELGEYAAEHHVIIGMEANPPIYGTNYITGTESAFELVNQVNSAGFQLTLDTGTILWNNESLQMISGRTDKIHHVHISEPYLKIIRNRKMHRELRLVLEKDDYSGFISVEMAKQDSLQQIRNVLAYVKGVFG